MKGMVLSTVGWLILAIVCVVLLAIFLSKLVPAIGDFMDAAIGGVLETICDNAGIFSGICHLLTGK